jgi:hypothetical protein
VGQLNSKRSGWPPERFLRLSPWQRSSATADREAAMRRAFFASRVAKRLCHSMLACLAVLELEGVSLEDI